MLNTRISSIVYYNPTINIKKYLKRKEHIKTTSNDKSTKITRRTKKKTTEYENTRTHLLILIHCDNVATLKSIYSYASLVQLVYSCILTRNVHNSSEKNVCSSDEANEGAISIYKHITLSWKYTVWYWDSTHVSPQW